jgi:hypothetical protein
MGGQGRPHFAQGLGIEEKDVVSFEGTVEPFAEAGLFNVAWLKVAYVEGKKRGRGRLLEFTLYDSNEFCRQQHHCRMSFMSSNDSRDCIVIFVR